MIMIKIGILIFVVSFLVIIVLRMSLTDVQKSLIILEAHNHPDYPSNRAIISGICVLLVLLGLFLAVFGGLFLI